MPNLLQYVYLASFFLTFLTLATSFHFIKAKLKEAGYDPAEIILFGLPPPSNLEEGTQNVNMSNFASGTYSQLFALVFTAVTTAFVYYKFNASTFGLCSVALFCLGLGCN